MPENFDHVEHAAPTLQEICYINHSSICHLSTTLWTARNQTSGNGLGILIYLDLQLGD